MQWLLARYPRLLFILRDNHHNVLYIKKVSKFNDFSPCIHGDWTSNTFYVGLYAKVVA
jgi:hypothetical protein